MSLRHDQAQFTVMFGQLISYATSHGLVLRLGDAWRNTEKLKCPKCDFMHSYQDMLVYNGRSQTLNSKHADRLAIDLVVERAIGGVVDTADWEGLGSAWEQLGGQWGGRWKSNDRMHFEYIASPSPVVVVA
jgi:D-alanyl-D-alanine carboxypeptidase